MHLTCIIAHMFVNPITVFIESVVFSSLSEACEDMGFIAHYCAKEKCLLWPVVSVGGNKTLVNSLKTWNWQ